MLFTIMADRWRRWTPIGWVPTGPIAIVDGKFSTTTGVDWRRKNGDRVRFWCDNQLQLEWYFNRDELTDFVDPRNRFRCFHNLTCQCRSGQGLGGRVYGRFSRRRHSWGLDWVCWSRRSDVIYSASDWRFNRSDYIGHRFANLFSWWSCCQLLRLTGVDFSFASSERFHSVAAPRLPNQNPSFSSVKRYDLYYRIVYRLALLLAKSDSGNKIHCGSRRESESFEFGKQTLGRSVQFKRWKDIDIFWAPLSFFFQKSIYVKNRLLE